MLYSIDPPVREGYQKRAYQIEHFTWGMHLPEFLNGVVLTDVVRVHALVAEHNHGIGGFRTERQIRPQQRRVPQVTRCIGVNDKRQEHNALATVGKGRTAVRTVKR